MLTTELAMLKGEFNILARSPMAIWVGTLPLVSQGLLFWDGQRCGLVSESTGGWNSIGLPRQLFVFDENEYDDDPTTPEHFSGQVATCSIRHAMK